MVKTRLKAKYWAAISERWSSLVESIYTLFAPLRLFEGSPWRRIWEAKERRVIIVTSQAWLILATIAYAAHFYLFDRNQQLQPLQFWLFFRGAMVCVLLGTALLYASPWIDLLGRFYRVPSAIAMWLMAYTQALVTQWYSVDAWAFCFIFVLVSLLILRMSVLVSLVYILLIFASLWTPLKHAGLPTSYLISGAIVTMALMIAFKAAHIFGIRSFLLEQRGLQQQREVIELRMLLADQIRLLIPKVIAKRIERLVSEANMAVRGALNQVLQPRQKNVVCLYSDIRGYTQATQRSQAFLEKAVIPEMTAMNRIIDDLEGVPRKIGDLLFAYFDQPDQSKNAVNGLTAAIKLSLITQNVNQSTVLPTIRRYFLLASGSAWVGNMGGNDSSVEITALGSPVNFVARLDELTKQPEIQKVLHIGDIVMSEQMHRLVAEHVPDLLVSELNLAELQVTVRDFAEVQKLYVVQAGQAAAYRLAARQFVGLS